MGNFLSTYKKVTSYPFGKFIFNKGIGFVSPFFRKLRPNVIDLRPAFCIVEMKDRHGLRNHMGTINAGAMCSLAELTAGMAVDAAIPAHLRWLPKGMSVSYLKKAKGTLSAKCEFDTGLLQQGDVVIPLEIKDTENDNVFSAEIIFYISEKKA
jgi:acyl-coenzyme A thioesterase PaaI-like protein